MKKIADLSHHNGSINWAASKDLNLLLYVYNMDQGQLIHVIKSMYKVVKNMVSHLGTMLMDVM